LKVKEVIKRLEAEGWRFDRQNSSHRTYKKIGVADIVTVSGIDSKDVSPGQLQ
jgi:predicted RNA binding protein YcfA (HicA-like mRNA interferase family)